MAKKSRTPPPPRRVQAPKARTGRTADDRRKFLILIGVAALGFVGIGVAAALFAFGGSGGGAQAIRDAGCTLTRYPGQARKHVTKLPKGFKYPSFPPTGGYHYPVPAPFDVYDQPVDQLRLVHNLEHGGVAIQYGKNVPRADVDALLAWYRDNPNGLVIAPLPALGSQIALAAWVAEVDARLRPTSEHGVLAKCPHFDADAFTAFVDEYGFRGPERGYRDKTPPELLAPGT